MALLAVAPLFLLPFLGRESVAVCLLWLSLDAALWVLMSPSCKPGELPHEARLRLFSQVLRDPVTWFALVAVAFAGVRALNGGIAIGYDAESMSWGVKPSVVEIFPGCVDGEGFLPFAASVAVFVVLVGARHALGVEASMAFFTSASAFSGIAALVSAIALSYGNSSVSDMAACLYESPSFAGTAYGLHLLGGVVALFGCAEFGWRHAEPFAAFGLVCSAVGLELFSPPATFAVFAIAVLLLLVAVFPMTRGRLVGSASFRCAIVVIMAAATVVIVAMFGEGFGPITSKVDSLLALKPFPDGFAAAREALSSVALKAWKDNPWLGSGLGSFPIDLRFSASPADWALVSPRQSAPMSGWWMVLAERGILGALVLAVGTGFLAWTYFRSLARARGIGRRSPACLLGPLAATVVASLSFVDCSLLRPDVLMPAAAAMALSSVAFRRGSRGQPL